MASVPNSMENAVRQIAAAVEQLRAARTAAGSSPPVVVALDGPSGSGKSTLGALLQRCIPGLVVVPLDDFFAAGIPDAGWEERTAAAKVRDVHDWARVRADVLAPLQAGRAARWHPFDFAAGPRPDGTYGFSAEAIVREPGPFILLEGAYAGTPQLADLVDLAVLVDVPPAVRQARLAAREEAQFLAAWHARWDEAESLYFELLRPPSSFDLVVSGG